MSKVFFDHLVDFGKIEKRIKKIAQTQEEREELYHLIDDILHHRVLGCIFEELPEKDHKEFVSKLKSHPHDKGLLDYLQGKISRDIREFLKFEIHSLATELLELIASSTKPKPSRE